MVDTERTVHRRYNRHDITSLITKLWDVAWDQSDHRNSVLHDSENYVTREQAEHMELQIRREKETGPQTLPDQDRDYLQEHRNHYYPETSNIKQYGCTEYPQHASETKSEHKRHRMGASTQELIMKWSHQSISKHNTSQHITAYYYT